jgi:DNA-binding beta-propeller fold protein YncE
MKQLLRLTTLFVAMTLLNSSATTSESATPSIASPRPVLLSANRYQEKAVRKSGAGQIRPRSIEIALVANAQAGTVALLEVASRSILGTIDVNPERAKGEGPGATNYAQDTDVSPDGRTLYVSRGYLGDVAAFDIASGRLLWRRSLDTGRADHMTLTPDGRSLFVSALLDNRVYKIAAATGEIAGHLVTGIYPHDNKVSRDGRLLYNTSIGPIGSLPRRVGSPLPAETPGYPFQLTIADVGSLTTLDRIRFDKGIRPWQFTPDEKGMYAQLSNEHSVVSYNLAARKVIKRLDLGRASDYAALVRAPDLTLIATIPVGDAPGWAETADNGRVCLVANTRSNDLSIISIPKRSEIVRLPIGKGPKHITVARIPESVVDAFKARQ